MPLSQEPLRRQTIRQILGQERLGVIFKLDKYLSKPLVEFLQFHRFKGFSLRSPIHILQFSLKVTFGF